MVSVTKKHLGNKTYYYLGHTYRYKGKVKKTEKYLGRKIPKNIDQLEKVFLFDIYTEKWYSKFEKIKENYQKEKKLMPVSASAKELETFMIKFTYDTQRIEGSKLTLKDTINLLEKGITPNQKLVRDIKEAEAHKKVFYEMINYDKNLSLQIITYWHKLLFTNTKGDIAGKIREHGVQISGSKFNPPTPVELNALLNEFFDWYNKNKTKVSPVELAALVHLKFVTIHPFSDGNGRISRLIMNFVLTKYGYPMIDIPYVNRSGYYVALERSQINKKNSIYVQWFFKKYLESNKRYLR